MEEMTLYTGNRGGKRTGTYEQEQTNKKDQTEIKKEQIQKKKEQIGVNTEQSKRLLIVQTHTPHTPGKHQLPFLKF